MYTIAGQALTMKEKPKKLEEENKELRDIEIGIEWRGYACVCQAARITLYTLYRDWLTDKSQEE